MSHDEHAVRIRFKVLLAVKMSVAVFWIVTPCGLAGGCQHFGGTVIPTYKSTWRHNIKNTIDILYGCYYYD
jgi:hypothetical protein